MTKPKLSYEEMYQRDKKHKIEAAIIIIVTGLLMILGVGLAEGI
jgi:hypothetical protein